MATIAGLRVLRRCWIQAQPVAFRFFSIWHRRTGLLARSFPIALQNRTYAKKSGGKKDKSSDEGEGKKAILDAEDLRAFGDRLKQSLELLQTDLQAIRVGNAMTSVLDKVTVEVEDKMLPLNQIGQVSVKDPQTLLFTVFDQRLLEKASSSIRAAELNLNPVVDKNTLRIPLPKMTLEYREQLTKLAAKAAEKAKLALRSHRQNILKDLKKFDSASKDDIKRIEKQIDKVSEESVKKVDEMVDRKNKEIMGVSK